MPSYRDLCWAPSGVTSTTADSRQCHIQRTIPHHDNTKHKHHTFRVCLGGPGPTSGDNSGEDTRRETRQETTDNACQDTIGLRICNH